ncbi:MAG: helix-turn-helix transcriptional regulator [Clostridiales bacterium]|nr:helix-turn-helix transcriptional regulator [Clostridiales bacterium]
MEILTLGEKVKAKRKEMNMTLKDLAEDRVTPGQISLVESGKSKPSIDLLEYIAEKLNTDIEYFLETEEKQATRICEFYANIAEAAIKAENTLRANESIEKGLHYAEKYKLTYFRGKFDLAFASLKYLNRELEEAQQYCISANSIFLKTESIEDIIKSFILIGVITLEMGYTSTSLNYFMQADNILNEYSIMNEILKAKIFYYIAICQSKMGNMSQAIDYSMLVKDRLKVLDNKREYAETLMILSIAYSQDNKVKEALKYAREARKIFDEINDVHEIASIETNLGVIFARGHDLDESFNHLNKALSLKHQINDNTIPDTLLIMCDNYIHLGEYNKALEIVSSTMDELDYEQHLYRIKCFEYLFKIYSKMDDVKKAEGTLLNAIKYLETLDFDKQLGDFYVLTGQFYIEIGEKELALKFINKGLDRYKDLGIILND